MKHKQAEHVAVAIIGAGPAGIGAAVGLGKQGIKPIVIIDRQKEMGGIPALYKKKKNSLATFAAWTRGRMLTGEEYAQKLRDKLSKYDIHLWNESQVLDIDSKGKGITFISPGKGYSDVTAEAVIMACGARERSLAERGWVTGPRPARIFFTKHLLDLIDGNDCFPLKKPVIIGSDLVAYAAAAKLKTMGASDAILIDTPHRPQCSLPERLYFRRWAKSEYRGRVKNLKVIGNHVPSAVKLADGELIPCDGIVVSGELIPNSELALLGNLKVELPSRKPILKKGYRLSESGWFATGNILGGFHGAEWCYFNGQRVARSVVKYLSDSSK